VEKKRLPRIFYDPLLNLNSNELIQENIALKSQLSAVIAERDLVTTTIKILGFQIQYKRLPSSDAKTEILAAIKKASECISLQACLLAIGLTAARYHHWVKRQVACLLDDESSCPRVSPRKMLPTKVSKIKELYTAKEFAHYSTIALSWFAKKTGEVVASASTWSLVVREHGLKRNRVRIYPAKPKIGIRASAPGQIWHLDLTILRLQDGSRVFVQAVIDNFSRYVLAWKVSPDYGGLRTRELLERAIAKATQLGLDLIPNVLVDSGTENLNSHVDQLVDADLISRTVAQIDVEASNSMVEMLFLRLKHRYLFTIPLTNFAAIENGVDFYFNESNTVIPHSALFGATPEEVITGKWTPEKMMEMKEKVVAAKLARTQSNTSRRCQSCLV
jgi:putative transposase